MITFDQTGLTDLQRTKIACGRMIRLHARPSTLPSPVSKLDRRHTGRLRKRDNLLTEEGGGMGVEPIHTTARKLGPL